MTPGSPAEPAKITTGSGSIRSCRPEDERPSGIAHQTIRVEQLCNDDIVPVPPDAVHLVPVLEALQASGNHPIGNWFLPNQGGWDCEMRQSLDLEFLQPLIELDPHRSQIVARNDEVTCLYCWVSIRGPSAPER